MSDFTIIQDLHIGGTELKPKTAIVVGVAATTALVIVAAVASKTPQGRVIRKVFA